MRIGGVEVEVNACLTSVLDGGEWSHLRPECFTPEVSAPGIQWVDDWVGFKSRSGRCDEKVPSLKLPGIELQSPIP
jgi:hypothetical protein